MPCERPSVFGGHNGWQWSDWAFNAFGRVFSSLKSALTAWRIH